MTKKDTNTDLKALLSEGMDLCVRAGQLDDKVNDAWIEAVKSSEDLGASPSYTIPLWIQEQYDADLSDWEQRSRNALAE